MALLRDSVILAEHRTCKLVPSPTTSIRWNPMGLLLGDAARTNATRFDEQWKSCVPLLVAQQSVFSLLEAPTPWHHLPRRRASLRGDSGQLEALVDNL